jgi:hypothetical protein
MAEYDLLQRIDPVIKALHMRALALAHPDQNHDMSEIFQALALILEMQRDLALEQTQILARLGGANQI